MRLASFQKVERQWKLVVRSAIECSTRLAFANASPLLEEKRYPLSAAFSPDPHNPIPQHWPCARSAFTPNDHPIYVSEIERTQILQQRLDGQKSKSRRCRTKRIDSRHSVLAIFDADAICHIRQVCHPA
jgi:hypothetical protein